MLSRATIEHLSNERAEKARAEGAQPVLYDGSPVLEFAERIPNIGDYRPTGFTLETELFVDKTGMGRPSEPALTLDQFERRLVPGKCYAITSEGQFQLYIGEFTPDATAVTVGFDN